MDRQKIAVLVKEKVRSSVLKYKPFIIAANWKMNKTSPEIRQYLQTLDGYDFSERNTVILFPPSPYLYLFREHAHPRIRYGTQNLYCEEKGAFTGEISPRMAKDLGCTYSILGHSERRNIFRESDGLIGRKVSACITAGIRPVLCIGEHLEERKSGRYGDVLRSQLEQDLAGVDASGASNLLVAYEPVWAIGTGVSASPEQIEETHGRIRQKLISRFGFGAGNGVPILYGGSVGPGNLAATALCENVSGFLIGGAALDVDRLIGMMDLMNEKKR